MVTVQNSRGYAEVDHRGIDVRMPFADFVEMAYR
jgi:hypothetical protein